MQEHGAGAPPGAQPPLVRVVAGHPTPEEVAALAAALAARRAALARQASATAAARPAVGGWSDRRRLLRMPPAPGPGAWRRSALPR
jgi:hypothetical protein